MAKKKTCRTCGWCEEAKNPGTGNCTAAIEDKVFHLSHKCDIGLWKPKKNEYPLALALKTG